MTAAEDKIALRRAALARRDALGRAERAAIATAIAAQPLPALRGTVSGYAAIRSEIDPLPLMLRLAAQGAALALPVVTRRDAPLTFRAWQPEAPLAPGGFGIREPLPEAPAVIPDVVLVPLAAFDRRGHRIGYGAGHYDRTLATLRGAGHAPVTIGIAAAVQEIAGVPALLHDVPLDYIVTEVEIIDARSGSIANSLHR
jgi:5-formyltetrahydrofolate cyclo-ligase